MSYEPTDEIPTGVGPQYVACCVCNAAVDTREESDGGTSSGAQLSNGEWVCSSRCWDLAVTGEEDGK